MIEVVGFLSVDPALSGEFQPEKDPLLDPQTETEVETITHNPPPSLVPRLHAVYVKKLDHCNPLVKSFDQGNIHENIIFKMNCKCKENTICLSNKYFFYINFNVKKVIVIILYSHDTCLLLQKLIILF